MPTSVAPRDAVRPKATGGRSTDPLILALEGTLEGLIACSDDRAVLLDGLTYLSHLAHESALLYRRAQYASAGHPQSGSRYAGLQDLQRRAVEHLRSRADRLTLAVLPELRAIATAVDAAVARRRRSA